MRAMGFRPVVALVPLLVFTACKSEQTIDTGAVVEVSSDLGPSEMNRVRLMGTDAQGQVLYDYTFDLTGPNPFALPLHAGIYPFHDTNAPIQVKAVGLLGNAPVVSRSATLSFEHGRQVLLRLSLLAVCKPVVCSEAYTTCKESGKCEPDKVTGPLPDYVPGQPAIGLDAAVGRPDAAAVDAPAEAGTSDGGLSPSDSRVISTDSPLSGGSMAGNTASSNSGTSTGGSTGGNTPLGGSVPSGGSTLGGGTGTSAAGGTGGNVIPGGGTSSAGKLSSGGVGGGMSSGGVTTSLGGTGGIVTTNGGITSAAGNLSSGGSGGVATSGGTTPVTGTTSSGGSGVVSSIGGTTSAAGSTSAGGTGGSSSSSGGTVSIERPAGYWKISDWGVSAVDWRGCVWAGKDNAVTGSDTWITPVDFTSGTPNGGPYQVSGSVFNDYNAVAMLGFNLNQAPTGQANQCAYDPMLVGSDGPPTIAMPPGGATGIAINWTATKLPLTFRIQIQGVKGGSDANSRWCATIKDATGPSFVPFTDFNTTCWDNKGKAYANEPIDAVAFLVPGTATAKSPYDITVLGFAPGTSKADAPGGAPICGTRTGTIGTSTVLADATQARDASYQRTAVTGMDCKKYVNNNNNWGQPTTTYQQLSFLGPSFTIDAANGIASGTGAPASFPSIYVGANGNTANGTFDTWSDTGLPKAISAIATAQTTFRWSGKSAGDFNATYDAWFAKTAPLPGSYFDGISGFLMVWLYKPASRSPTNNDSDYHRTATIDGKEWDVWIGPRGIASTGTDDKNRPVISYVAKSTITSFSGDLKPFFDDAVSNATSDKANAGTSQAFSADWYLTDVFAGFEVWTGSDGVGLKADEFTFQLN
jgi:hypothetical protein